MRKKLLTGLLVTVMAITFLCPLPALAANPQVAITITAELVAITNTQATFAIGTVEAGGSAVKWGASDTHSQIANTGSVACDIELQGTNIEGGVYDWTLGASAGDKIYMLKANTEGAPTVYSIEIKSSTYTDLKTNLAVDATWNWSMEFTPPTIFDAADAGAEKSSTLTLVASKTA